MQPDWKTFETGLAASRDAAGQRASGVIWKAEKGSTIQKN